MTSSTVACGACAAYQSPAGADEIESATEPTITALLLEPPEVEAALPIKEEDDPFRPGFRESATEDIGLGLLPGLFGVGLLIAAIARAVGQYPGQPQ
jgi:hypothetical protein